ncbi:alpha-1,3-mannosyl-glycoprotein 4-beta-N-acetylglucosaminyltransferase B-like, partial [Thalassophryne amazonica]|uniref:alpha-1,3-mannosyl-glycoprotein 4-beta-N-acetylglucosaminyltransferase B-like n=1 Tax=Thalassophryne amazonica TaxID=390379 RepID=UPI0014711A60
SSSDPHMFLQPILSMYLPHLRDHPDSIKPNVLLSQGRCGVSLVLGVPTVKRAKQNYLINTLSSLLYNLTPAQRHDLLIIIFVAETDSDYVSSITEAVRKK